MRIVNPSFEILEQSMTGAQCLSLIEIAARNCYKSEDKICDGSAEKMCKILIDNKHEAMLEHSLISVRIICDRAVSHEFVRHRHFSFAQESQRYVNYGKEKNGNEITFVKPIIFDIGSVEFNCWQCACVESEQNYFEMLNYTTPENARTVLTNSTKTEMIVTGNARQWRLFFDLRTPLTAHPDMRYLANIMLVGFKEKYHVLFDDLGDIK